MKPGLGTQLRHLLDLLDGAVGRAYDDAGLRYRPRYTPVMRALIALEPLTIGQIAEAAGITQPAATQTVALMIKEGLVRAEPGPVDGRQRLIRLTREGRALLPQLRDCWQATEIAAASLDAALPRPLSQSLGDAISALEGKSFDSRIVEARTQLEKKSSRKSGAPRKRGKGNDAVK
jgi:DNA-binding MarR family transcriptional regulator